MSKFIKCVVSTVAASLVLWSAAPQAQAGQKLSCTVYDVEFYTRSDIPMMIMHCLGDQTSYRAYYAPNNDGCPVLTLDQVKTYNTMISAAYIANKTLVINWTVQSCGGPQFSQTIIDSVFLSP
jgi:hypothetical protein